MSKTLKTRAADQGTLDGPAPLAGGSGASNALLYLALALTLLPQLVRAMSSVTSLPGWDLDPLVFPISENSITPAGSMLADAATMLGAALLLAWSARRRIVLHVPLILLSLIGAACVVLHGWVLGAHQGSLGNQRIGSAWLSAVLGAVAVWHAAQDLRVRRIVAGTLLGFMMPLALYGVVQIFYVHPQTLADFNADPSRFLAAHGWTPNSSMALSFVRRLSQPEATGWFALANVYATFAAGAVAAGLGMLCGPWALRRFGRGSVGAVDTSSAARDPLSMAVLVCFAVAGAVSLYFANSKGGYLGAIAALAAMGLLALVAARARLSPGKLRGLAIVLGLGAIAGPIALVLIRGLFGEHSGERSLLFRSYYARAATRIFLDHPLFGVGPDGFQRAFTIVKSPLCPEEVTSPHCIVWDWSATLGVFGIAWICVLARMACSAVARAVTPVADAVVESDSSVSRSDVRFLLLLPAAATILATYIEPPYGTLDSVFARLGLILLGLILWCVASRAIAGAISGSFSTRLALAGMALAVVAHAQIDVTASFVQSTALWSMMIAIAAAPAIGPEIGAATIAKGAVRSSARWLVLAALPGLGLCVLMLTTVVNRVAPWERLLMRSALAVRPLAEFTDRLNAATQKPPAGSALRSASRESISRIVADLSKAIGREVQPTPASVGAALAALGDRLLPPAATELEQAYAIYPDERRPLREASRLHLQLAQAARERGDLLGARAGVNRATQTLRLDPSEPGAIPDPSATEWAWLAVLLEGSSDLLDDPTLIGRAAQARLNAVPLDPYNLDNALKLFRDYERLGDKPNAGRWAARALELHEDMRLDRETRGLSAEDLADARRAAGKP